MTKMCLKLDDEEANELDYQLRLRYGTMLTRTGFFRIIMRRYINGKMSPSFEHEELKYAGEMKEPKK